MYVESSQMKDFVISMSLVLSIPVSEKKVEIKKEKILTFFFILV